MTDNVFHIWVFLLLIIELVIAQENKEEESDDSTKQGLLIGGIIFFLVGLCGVVIYFIWCKNDKDQILTKEEILKHHEFAKYGREGAKELKK